MTIIIFTPGDPAARLLLFLAIDWETRLKGTYSIAVKDFVQLVPDCCSEHPDGKAECGRYHTVRLAARESELRSQVHRPRRWTEAIPWEGIAKDRCRSHRYGPRVVGYAQGQ